MTNTLIPVCQLSYKNGIHLFGKPKALLIKSKNNKRKNAQDREVKEEILDNKNDGNGRKSL